MPGAFDDALEALEERTKQILRYHRVCSDQVEDDEIVAHFTSWEACCAIFKVAADHSQHLTLWASDVTCLNDPLEGKALRVFAHDACRRIENGSEYEPPYVSGKWLDYELERANAGPFLSCDEWMQLDATLMTLDPETPAIPAGTVAPVLISSGLAYLISFCRDADRLDLWRAYTQEATGVSLVMPLREAVRELNENDWGFYRVAYDERSKTRALVLLREPLCEAARLLPPKEQPLERQANVAKVLAALGPLPYMFKHEQFQSEREVRLIPLAGQAADVEKAGQQYRAVVKTDPFFLAPCTSKIILGPRCPERSVRAAVLDVWLRKIYGPSAPRVTYSAVPYQ